ncbi:MAG: polymerase [Acidimicrobiales bacterium]|nr:polymerase [Acidimicrobiales bacterium]
MHADLDSFFASVEQRDDPSLRGRPMAVGGGVILAASYEAKAFGVRTAMGVGRARLACPGLIVVPPRFHAYSEASRAVFALFEDTTPLVEGISIDEAFLEVGGLRRLAGRPVEIAARLRARVRDEVGLAITVGIASTKFLAKVASAVAKPDGLLLVPAGTELAFLHPLPIERLWGVGPATSERLRSRGILTVGELAAVPGNALASMLGRGAAHHLNALAHARDPRRVETGRRRRSIGAQRALGSRPHTPAEIDTSLVALVDRVTSRMRKAERVGRTVMLRLRLGDFSRLTRSHSVAEATAHTPTILMAARALLESSGPLIAERGLTLVGISVGNLVDERAVQLSLPFDAGSSGALDAAVDDIRTRFGTGSVTRAVLLHHSPSLEMPLLPD